MTVIETELNKGTLLEPPVLPVAGPVDPDEPVIAAPKVSLPEAKPDYGINVPELSPAAQWLFDNRRNLNQKPYVAFGKEGIKGGPVVRRGMELLYPGIADKIRKARDAGYSDDMVAANIESMVAQALDAGYTDEQIESNIFKRKKQYGILEGPLAFLYQGRRSTIEKTYDYFKPETIKLAQQWQRYKAMKYTEWEPPLEMGRLKPATEAEIFYWEKFEKFLEEIVAVNARGISGFTAGVSDLVFKEKPETAIGTVAGSAAQVAGFILGPLKFAKYAVGGRLAPTAKGLKGMVQLSIQGGATLALASGISDIVPSIEGSENLTQAGVQIVNSAGMSALVGSLYPLAGAIPSKPLRMAVGLAALDVIRNKGEMSIDDVIRGVKDGTIDRNELAERSFGYLLDLYFISKVPTMKAQLQTLEKNALIREMLKVNGNEAEQVILELSKRGLVPGVDEKYLDGATRFDKRRAFGTERSFESAYKALHPQTVKLASEMIKAAEQAKLPPSAQRKFMTPSEIASKQQYLKDQVTNLENAVKTEIMYNLADVELERLSSGKIKRLYQNLARTTWDTSANIKSALLKKGGRLGKEAIVRHDLVRGASPKAEELTRRAAKQVYGGLNKAELKTLDRIIQSRRIIAIENYKPGMKHPGGLTAKEHSAYLKSLPQDVTGKLNERADMYFREMQNQLTALYREGLLTKQSYEALKATGDYQPRRFIQYIDGPDRQFTVGGKTISVSDAGIKKLDVGSYQSLENNSRLLLGEVVKRTQNRIFRNRANKALWEIAKNVPDNGVVKAAKVIRTTKDGKPVYQKTPGGFEKISVVVDGIHKEMLMPTGLAGEWVTSDPAVSSGMANTLSWLSGAKILKPFATGINPEFAVSNLPRDMAHAWLVTQEWSPHIPVAAVQMSKDYAKTFTDSLLRRGAFLDYVNEGGSMSFLTHQGRVTQKTTGVLRSVQDALGYLGETSEIWTRLALRNRALSNGKAPHEATWTARSYIDFSVGGSYIKGADAAVPYLNASVQGTRGLFRAAKDKPGVTSYKLAQVGTLAMGLYYANRHTNPEAWASVSEHDKANNFILTTPIKFTDEDGQERHLYFKIPKDQSQKLAATIFEALAAKSIGEDIDVDQVSDAAKGIIDLSPSGFIPPTLEAGLGVLANKDFWYNEDIWPGPEVEPEAEYRPGTHPAFVKWGELTGFSPMRTKYALEQVFTKNNIYTSLTGWGLRQIMDSLPEDVREKTTTEMLQQAPFLRRVLKATHPYTPYAKSVEKTRIAESTRRYKQNMMLDALSERYYAEGKTDMEPVREYFAEQPWQDRSRLIARHRRYGDIRNIPDRTWWLNIIDLPSEARATAYWDRYKQESSEKQSQLDGQMRRLPGVVTDRFMLRLNQLKKK